MFVSVGTVAQEFPVIGQYMFNEMLLNPASTGYQGAFVSQYSFRKQWIQVDGSPTTQNLSIQSPFKREDMALGFIFYRDQLGVSSESGIITNYAYRLKLADHHSLIFGVGGGLFFQRVRYSELDVTHPGDQIFLADSPLGILPNFSGGVKYTYQGFELGLSVPKFLSTTYSQSSRQFDVQHRFGNYNFLIRSLYAYQITPGIELRLGGLFKYHVTMDSQLDVITSAEFKEIVQLGFGYRSSEGFLLMSRVNIIEQLDVGFQYEIPTSKLYSYRSGTLELSIIYTSLFNSKAKNPRHL